MEMTEKYIDFITSRLSQGELLAQLAEECTELAKAALKLRRVYDGENPTPVSERQALDNLAEEIIDVHVCLSVMGLAKVDSEGDKRYEEKMKRWCSRLLGCYGEN